MIEIRECICNLWFYWFAFRTSLRKGLEGGVCSSLRGQFSHLVPRSRQKWTRGRHFPQGRSRNACRGTGTYGTKCRSTAWTVNFVKLNTMVQLWVLSSVGSKPKLGSTWLSFGSSFWAKKLGSAQLSSVRHILGKKARFSSACSMT